MKGVGDVAKNEMDCSDCTIIHQLTEYHSLMVDKILAQMDKILNHLRIAIIIIGVLAVGKDLAQGFLKLVGLN